jgi:hypothetical protein
MLLKEGKMGSRRFSNPTYSEKDGVHVATCIFNEVGRKRASTAMKPIPV